MSFYEYLESNVYWNGEKPGRDYTLVENVDPEGSQIDSKPFWTLAEILP